MSSSIWNHIGLVDLFIFSRGDERITNAGRSKRDFVTTCCFRHIENAFVILVFLLSCQTVVRVYI